MVKKLSPSLEDYLEAILRLEEKYRVARVKDIAKALGVQMPSVTGALKSLRQKGLVNYQKNSFISLTETGKTAAEMINSRHYILDTFLKEILGLEPSVASAEACGIEHVISGDTAERIKNLGEYIKTVVFKKVSRQEWEALLLKPDSEAEKEEE